MAGLEFKKTGRLQFSAPRDSPSSRPTSRPSPCFVPGEWLYRFSAGFASILRPLADPRPTRRPSPRFIHPKWLGRFSRPTVQVGEIVTTCLSDSTYVAPGRAKSACEQKMPFQTDCLASARDADEPFLPKWKKGNHQHSDSCRTASIRVPIPRMAAVELRLPGLQRRERNVAVLNADQRHSPPHFARQCPVDGAQQVAVAAGRSSTRTGPLRSRTSAATRSATSRAKSGGVKCAPVAFRFVTGIGDGDEPETEAMR